MVILKQDTKLEKHKLENLLNRYGHVEYRFNSQLIQDDIDKIVRMSTETSSKNKLENLKRIKGYLEGLLKRSKKGSFYSDWVLTGNRITSIPVEIRRLKAFNIQATDYINSDKGSIIALDYTELMNIIAFEIGYKDFDMTIEEIESKLDDVGIISIYDSSRLSGLVDKNCYDKALVMKIGDTPYISPDKKYVYTYFNDKVDYNGYYRNVIEESCATAISIIVYNILNIVNSCGYGVTICGIFDDSIYLTMTNGRNDKIEEDIAVSAVVRTFGRKFEVQPKVQVY